MTEQGKFEELFRENTKLLAAVVGRFTEEEKDMLVGLTKYLATCVCFTEVPRVKGCDNTLALTESWMRMHRVSFEYWRPILNAAGGYCDCEVLLNSIERLIPERLEEHEFR